MPLIKIYPGVNLPRRSTYYMTPGANPAVLVIGLHELSHLDQNSQWNLLNKLTIHQHERHKWPVICSTYHKHFLSSPHSWLINGFTRRVPLLEQELLTFPKLTSSRPLLVSTCYYIFSFMYMFCLSFVLFLLTIVLSVLLRFTDYDYPFGIYKLVSINRE